MGEETAGLQDVTEQLEIEKLELKRKVETASAYAKPLCIDARIEMDRIALEAMRRGGREKKYGSINYPDNFVVTVNPHLYPFLLGYAIQILQETGDYDAMDWDNYFSTVLNHEWQHLIPVLGCENSWGVLVETHYGVFFILEEDALGFIPFINAPNATIPQNKKITVAPHTLYASDRSLSGEQLDAKEYKSEWVIPS